MAKKRYFLLPMGHIFSIEVVTLFRCSLFPLSIFKEACELIFSYFLCFLCCIYASTFPGYLFGLSFLIDCDTSCRGASLVFLTGRYLLSQEEIGFF